MKNIHIAMICDDNYILPTCVAIQSFIESMNDDIIYNIHIVMSSCSEESYNKINKFNSKHVIMDVVHRNAEIEFNNFHIFNEDAMCCASIAALLKFSLGEIFSDLNKILYLDGDLISNISLEELYDIDITDYYGAAVIDSGTMYSTRHINNRTFENYFNSGVMLLNLKKIRKDNKILELMDTKKNLKDSSLMDQNVFNIVFENKMKMLPIKYNLLAVNLKRAESKWTIEQVNKLYKTNYISKDQMYDNASIIHYASKDKPWKTLNTPFSSYWINSYFKAKKLLGGNLYPQVIVSLTSYPGRIDTVHTTIISLLEQNYSGKKIILWLAESQFKNKEADLPSSLCSLLSENFSIEWCEDLRSYKKFIPVLEKYPDEIIVTADDDIIYPKDWLTRLVVAFLAQPDMIHCQRAHIVKMRFGKILPYRMWLQEIQSTSPAFSNFCTTGGGIIFKKTLLHDDILRKDLYLNLCPDADDIWFWGMAVLKGTKINLVYPPLFLNYVPGTQGDEALWRTNMNHGNDRKLNNFLMHYPVILTIISKELRFTNLKKIFKIEQTSKCKAYSLFGISIFQRRVDAEKIRIFCLGIQIYKLSKQDKKTKYYLFGIPIASKTKN